MITVAYYFLFLVGVGAASDRWHLGSTLGHPRPENRFLFRRERSVRLGIVAPPLALSVQMVTATEVWERRFRRVVHKRLPVILAGGFRSPSSWVNDYIVGVTAASSASLRESQSPRRLLRVRGTGTEFRL